MYYFQDMETFEKLKNLPAHMKAKGEVDRWYKSYRIELYEVKDIYGKDL